MPFKIYSQNSQNLPSTLSLVAALSPSKELVNLRWVNAVEFGYNYYYSAAIQANPKDFAVLKVENGGSLPVMINDVTIPANPHFQLIHRNEMNYDPIYGYTAECSSQADFTRNRVNVLATLNALCLVVYKIDHLDTVESTMVNVKTSANKNYTFPYGGNPFTVRTTTALTPSAKINWQEITVGNLAADETWSSFAYGNGHYVVLSNNHRNQIDKNKSSYSLTTSSDGLNWTSGVLPKNIRAIEMAFGNGVFVAIGANDSTTDEYGQNNVALSSPDGVNWTVQKLPVKKFWYSVTYGNGKFVAVSDIGNIAAVSSDGKSWTKTLLPQSAYWRKVVYGNGRFVAVEDSGKGNIAISYDGVNWSAARAPKTDPGNLINLKFGNGLFLLTSGAVNYTSVDGVNWQLKPNLELSLNSALNFANGSFFYLYSNYLGKTSFIFSVDANNWQTDLLSNHESFVNWGVTGYGNNKYIALSRVSNKGLIGFLDYSLSTTAISGAPIVNQIAPAVYLDKNILIANIESRNYFYDALEDVRVGWFGLKGYTMYNLTDNDIEFNSVYYSALTNDITIDWGRTTCSIRLNPVTRNFTGVIVENSSCDVVLRYQPTVAGEFGEVYIENHPSAQDGKILLTIPYSSRL
ncbi:MAG: hypothetical protein K2X94_04220 [Amoebophilaceae bacterium]|nr:hypothetical protein [Amoebophilaceae bacterium]